MANEVKKVSKVETLAAVAELRKERQAEYDRQAAAHNRLQVMENKIRQECRHWNVESVNIPYEGMSWWCTACGSECPEKRSKK